MELDITLLQKRLDEMNAEITALRQKYMEESKRLFHESVKQFFDVAPAIKAIHWTQYTPYFNDGDECVFGVNDICYSAGPDTPDIHYLGGYESENAFFELDVEEHEKKIAEYQQILDGKLDLTDADKKRYPYYRFFDQPRYGVATTTPTLNRKALENEIEEYRDELDRFAEQQRLYPDYKNDIENFKVISRFIEKIPDDSMEEIFGNHVLVMVTRDGVETTEWDHD